MLSYNELIEIHLRNRVDYHLIKKSCEFNLINNASVDVSVIIPIKGRENFNVPLVNHLISAMEFYKEKRYSITFVEHSEISTHKNLCKNRTNHIWIKKDKKDFFNKCLAMNVGVLFSNKAKYYLFHDVDMLVNNNFFSNIFSNFSKIDENSALQTFGGRRVVVMNKELTDSILKNKIKIENVKPGDIRSPYSKSGAPGGSIFISSNSFFKVGGFEPEFFHSYSCEDAFFYHKLETTVGIQGCNNPSIEIYHMDHPKANIKENINYQEQLLIHKSFMNLHINDKLNFISYVSNNFNKAIV
jgi:hypothetical protein